LLSLFAGTFGAILGLGGGIFLVPALTLLVGVPIKFAVSTSLIAVVATSVASSSIYLKKGFTNLRLGLLLETTTVLGAVIGSSIAIYIKEEFLALLFSFVALYTAIAMWRSKKSKNNSLPSEERKATKSSLNLSNEFIDPSTGNQVSYAPKNLLAGTVLSSTAGAMSALLGIGGGPIKVPLMRLVMGIPLKAATATSSFMVGITASASALIYLGEGLVKTELAIPAVLGIFLGARAGALVAGKIKSRYINFIFVILLIIIALEMFMKGIGAVL